jgi:hypothetical protein
MQPPTHRGPASPTKEQETMRNLMNIPLALVPAMILISAATSVQPMQTVKVMKLSAVSSAEQITDMIA